MAAILTFAFAFGSAMYAFSNKYLLVGVVLLFYILIQRLLHWHRRQKFLHQAMVVCGGKSFRLNALMDSGNALTDPVSGQPVSIISLSVFLQMFPKISADKILLNELGSCLNGHYINCRTVNGQSQLFVFSPEQIKVDGTAVQSLLGVNPKYLGQQKYDAILNIKLGGVL